MSFLKRFALLTVAVALLVMPAFAAEADPAQAYHLSPAELTARVEETYDEALALAGRRSFHGKCSTLVNCSTLALGIQTVRFDGNGRDEYDLYADMTRTDGGYDVVRFGAPEYDLSGALMAVTENGTRDVYNIIVGFQGGRTASSRAYGHTCFIHGILDGMVYFCESYGLELNGRFYREGEPIVCTMAEFAAYYDIWARFEGIVHLDFPDVQPPEMTVPEITGRAESGFVLAARVSDNRMLDRVYAKVWLYGQTEADGVTVPAMIREGTAVVRIDAEAFDDYCGKYYVNLYTVDGSGNTTVVSVAPEGIDLYPWQVEEATFRVKRNNTGIHNAPYVRVNQTNTREGVVNRGVDVQIVGSYVNDNGERWYRLTDGGWICGENLRQIRTLGELWAEMKRTLLIHR